MIQLDQVVLEKKCARCRQAIRTDPAFEDELWYHRPCLEEGKRALQRAHELAVRFGGLPANFRTS